MSDILGGPLLHKKEVIWALQRLKVKDSAGKDGLRAEMANREMLVGAVQSVLVQWNESISYIVRIVQWYQYQRRRLRELVEPMSLITEISLVSVVYEVMCIIIQERLLKAVVERQLLAEEQGGFRRGRNVEIRSVAVALLGQTMMAG